MEKVRVALIGAGPMGVSMVLNAHKTGRVIVAALCDRSSVMLDAASVRVGEATGRQPVLFESYDALKETGEYDAVMIACSPEIQPKLAVSEMRRGKHVLCQVPVAVTMEDCRALISAARETGVVFVGAEQAHCWHFLREWRRMAQAGTLGKIIFAEGSYLHYEPKWPWFVNQQDGTMVHTDDPSLSRDPAYEKSWRYRVFEHPILYLPHTLNPLLQITGGRITRVSCLGTRPESYYTKGFQVRDLESAIMYNDRDTVFSVKVGFTSPHGSHAGTGAHWYQLKGTEGTVEWARSEIDAPKLYDAQSKEWHNMPWSVADPQPDALVKESGHGGVDMYPILDFLDAIQQGKKPRMDALACVELAAPAIAAAQSSEQGGALVEVPDFRRE